MTCTHRLNGLFITDCLSCRAYLDRLPNLDDAYSRRALGGAPWVMASGAAFNDVMEWEELWGSIHPG